MTVKMCSYGDYKPAVGTGRRPVLWCRDHYLQECGAEFVRVEVIGDLAITDVRTGESVGKGGTVELDPEETRIEQLVYAGHVNVLPAGEAAAAKTAAKKG